MARKARNGASEQKEAALGKSRVAVYARLSKEREDTIERGTIENQVSLIKDYINRHENMEIAYTYVDDSISGTGFDRPGFERMMADMKAERFDVIAVKDLSRLGRDYIEIENFIERVFPLYGIRFIAITDGYDSRKGGMELMMPVTNIANALYAQDISKKISSAKREQMGKGIPVGIVPYGYRVERGVDGTRRMVIDEEAAEVVREVFRRYLNGEKKMEIAYSLNDRGIPSPYQYRFRDHPEKLVGKEHLQWTLANINKILTGEVYTGKYVVGKDVQCLYRHEKRHIAPESEWLVYDDHHPAIISREEFDAAQNIGTKQGYIRRSEPNLFRGKVVCGFCGSNVCDFRNHGERYYMCARKRRYGARNCDCQSNSVAKHYLYETVLSAIQEMIRLFLDEDAAVKAYRQSAKGREERKHIQNAIYKAEEDLKRAKEMKAGLYTDFREGLLNEREYLLMNGEYSDKIGVLEQKLVEVKELLKRMDHTPFDNAGLKAAVRSFKGKRKLTPEMVDAFIDRITLYEHRRMEIRFTFDDEMKLALEIQSERGA